MEKQSRTGLTTAFSHFEISTYFNKVLLLFDTVLNLSFYSSVRCVTNVAGNVVGRHKILKLG